MRILHSKLAHPHPTQFRYENQIHMSASDTKSTELICPCPTRFQYEDRIHMSMPNMKSSKLTSDLGATHGHISSNNNITNVLLRLYQIYNTILMDFLSHFTSTEIFIRKYIISLISYYPWLRSVALLQPQP